MAVNFVAVALLEQATWSDDTGTIVTHVTLWIFCNNSLWTEWSSI